MRNIPTKVVIAILASSGFLFILNRYKVSEGHRFNHETTDFKLRAERRKTILNSEIEESLHSNSLESAKIEPNMRKSKETVLENKSDLIDSHSDQAPFKVTENLIKGIDEELNKELSMEGFNQDEIDKIVSLVVAEYRHHSQYISISSAIDNAADQLKFDSSQRKKMTKSILAAVDAVEGQITFDEWRSCLNKRLSGLSSCLREAGNDIVDQVANDIDGNFINTKNMALLDKKAIQYKITAVKTCGITIEQAEEFFDLTLSGCTR